MKRKRLSFCLCLVMMITLLLPSAFAGASSNAGVPAGPSTYAVYMNGKPAAFQGQQPVIESGELLVPLEAAALQAGWIVDAGPGASGKGKATIANNAGATIEIDAAKGTIVANGQVFQTPVKPEIRNKTPMMPLRTVTELLNGQYEWDDADHSAYVFTPVFTGYSDKWAVMQETKQAPVIDGSLNDKMWKDAAVLDRFVAVGSAEGAEPDPQVKAAYDQDKLYLGVTIATAQAEGVSAQRGFHVMLTTPSAPGSYYNIPIVLQDGQIKIIPNWGPGIVNLTDYTARTVSETRSSGVSKTVVYTTEIAVPLHAIQQQQPAAGDQWGINVLAYRIVDRHPVFTTWYPVLRSFERDWAADAQTPNTYNFWADIVQEGRVGQLYFETVPAAPSKGKDKFEAWQPEDVKLEYKSFTEAGFSYKAPNNGGKAGAVELVWKSPTGERTTLQQVHTAKVGDRIVVTFEHPNPTDRGMYELEATVRKDDGKKAEQGILSFDGQQLIEAGMRAHVHQIADPGTPKRHVELQAPSAEAKRLLDLIPKQTGLYYLGDPTSPLTAPRTLYNWSPDNPSVVVSKVSQLAFPNGQYPENKSLKVTNRSGQTVEYPYYEDALGKKYFFTAQVWYKQREYVLAQMKTLATTDPAGAARVLYRFAQVYQNYVPVNDYLWNQYPIDANAGSPSTYWGGIWSYWYYLDLPSIANLLTAYQTLKQTDIFDQLSKESGENVERKLVDGMFKPSAEYDRNFSILNGNMDYQLWLGYLSLARAIGEPDYVHDAVALMNQFLNSTYLFDGSFMEVSISYHNQSTNGFNQVAAQLKTYADPPGYTSPRTGTRLDNPDLLNQLPILGKAKELAQTLVYPNGSVLPVGDTWAFEKNAAPLSRGSILYPAAGVARFSQNGGPNESQLYMTFTPKYGHYHDDPLNLSLYAKGQELLSDIGYTHTLYRYAAVSTMGHNTVLVNSKDSDNVKGKNGGSLQLFAPLNPSLQVMRASQENAYPGVAQYEREPWFIGLPGGDGTNGYVVDVFRVAGGSRHEYTLNGDANRDAAFETSVPMATYNDRLLPPGTNATEATTELELGSAEGQYPGYIYMKDVKRGELADGKYELTMSTKLDNSQPGAKLNLFGFAGEGSELFLGTYPSVRSTRLSGTAKDTTAEAVKYTMPKLVVRRDGTDLKSTFTTVMEPYAVQQGPTIEKANVLNADASASGNVALEVKHGEYTDYIMSSNDPDRTFTVGDLSLKGKAGFIRMKNGAVESMTLIGGTLLRKGDRELAGIASVSGAITGVKRIAEGDADNAIVTDTEVSQDMVGRYAIVTHPDQTTNGFRIKSISTADHRSTLVLDDMDPGFHIAENGSSRMTSYKSWEGAHRFTIDGVSASGSSSN